jgi:hypothetical protein
VAQPFKARFLSALFALTLLLVGTFFGAALWHPAAFAQVSTIAPGQPPGQPGQVAQPVSVGGAAGSNSAAVVAYGNGVVALIWPAGIRTYRVDLNGQIVKLDAKNIDAMTGDLTTPPGASMGASATLSSAGTPAAGAALTATASDGRQRIYSFGPGYEALNEVVWKKGGHLTGFDYASGHDAMLKGRTSPVVPVVLLYALDDPDRPDARAMPEIARLFPRPLPEVEAVLRAGKTLAVAGQVNGTPVVLLAAPTGQGLHRLIEQQAGQNTLLDGKGILTP